MRGILILVMVVLTALAFGVTPLLAVTPGWLTVWLVRTVEVGTMDEFFVWLIMLAWVAAVEVGALAHARVRLARQQVGDRQGVDADGAQVAIPQVL